MTKYLFLFTIGPVQSFISTARKTKDLYAGSKILSELIDVAIKEFNNNSNVIFPAPNFNLKSKPNRFLAILENQSPDELGKKLEQKVLDEFVKLGNCIPNLNNGSEKFKEKFYNQLEDFLNIHWAAVPYNENEYKENYAELEKYLASVKNVKPFKQLPEGENHRKCSLAGDRDALVYYKSDKLPAYAFKESLKTHSVQLAQGEGLSAVSAIKRFYQAESSFPSTAEICLMETFNKIQNNELKKFYEENEIQLCYEENLTDDYFRKNNIDKSKKDDCIKKQEELSKEAKKNNIKLTKYYAILVFDGDSMGTWLSGENLKDKSKLREFHREMSEKLGEFAKYSKGYLQYPKGKAVYAGGDDFLGFVNVNYIFKVLKDLREKFSEIMKPLEDKYVNNKKFSFSAGIAVAHYKNPLEEVLNWARKMEKLAKEENNKSKDSFAIAVLKHSGEIHKTVYKFNNNEINLPDIFDKVNIALANDYFSDTFAKSLEIELDSIYDKKETRSKDEIKKKIVETEIKRLIKRSEIKENIRSKDLNTDKFINYITELYNKSHSIQNFVSALNILIFLKREINPGGNK